LDSDASDYSSDESEGNDSEDEWDLNNKVQEFEDPTKLKFSEYKYCIYNSHENALQEEVGNEENGFRRTLFILYEIINDLGF
jgi:hypothetical protein